MSVNILYKVGVVLFHSCGDFAFYETRLNEIAVISQVGQASNRNVLTISVTANQMRRVCSGVNPALPCLALKFNLTLTLVHTIYSVDNTDSRLVTGTTFFFHPTSV